MEQTQLPPTAKGQAVMVLFNCCHKNNYPITNLKYQKLLYYLHGWTMALKKICYFEANAFEAWKFGPVHVKEYHHYKHYGDQQIAVHFPDFEGNNFLVSCIANHYAKHTESQLIEMTHKETPWLENKNCVIPDEEIQEYFSSQEILKNPVHARFLDHYLHHKDSVPFDEVTGGFSENVPLEEWAAFEKEFGLLPCAKSASA